MRSKWTIDSLRLRYSKIEPRSSTLVVFEGEANNKKTTPFAKSNPIRFDQGWDAKEALYSRIPVQSFLNLLLISRSDEIITTTMTRVNSFQWTIVIVSELLLLCSTGYVWGVPADASLALSFNGTFVDESSYHTTVNAHGAGK